jgi:hypothetical protein
MKVLLSHVDLISAQVKTTLASQSIHSARALVYAETTTSAEASHTWEMTTCVTASTSEVSSMAIRPSILHTNRMANNQLRMVDWIGLDSNYNDFILFYLTILSGYVWTFPYEPSPSYLSPATALGLLALS